MQDYTKLSKFLSLILRHNPGAAGITIDKNGWAVVSELLTGINNSGKRINMEMLEELVNTNDKQRFCFNEDKTKIRASQGHSVKVDVELKVTIPPDVLYHGTASLFYKSIMQKGLLKRSRNYVHLSQDTDTAFKVGLRHGFPIVLKVDAASMQKDGYIFYLSENGVWLTDHVPFRYIEKIK